MSGRRLPPSLALLAAATFAGSGCNGLAVDREAMAFSFPRDRPEVRVLLVYEGLRVRGDRPEDLAEAKKQLAELFVNRQEFWLGGSGVPFRFSLRAPAPPGEDKPLLALLRKHVTIDRTELFTPPAGRPRPAPPPNPLDKDLRAFARRLEIPFRQKVEVAEVVEDFLKAPGDGREK